MTESVRLLEKALKDLTRMYDQDLKALSKAYEELKEENRLIQLSFIKMTNQNEETKAMLDRVIAVLQEKTKAGL